MSISARQDLRVAQVRWGSGKLSEPSAVNCFVSSWGSPCLWRSSGWALPWYWQSWRCHGSVNSPRSLLSPVVFFSPGFIVRERKCSICGEAVSAVHGCGHRKGDIYGGRLCYHLIEDAVFLEISFVKKPIQRFAVPFMVKEDGTSKDHYNYALVDYVVSGLASPFSDWCYTKTKSRHPHSRYADVSPSAPCPCESGRSYEECCLLEAEGVLRPHLDIVFSDPPPDSLPRRSYSDDWSPSGAGHAEVFSRQRSVEPPTVLDPDM